MLKSVLPADNGGGISSWLRHAHGDDSSTPPAKPPSNGVRLARMPPRFAPDPPKASQHPPLPRISPAARSRGRFLYQTAAFAPALSSGVLIAR